MPREKQLRSQARSAEQLWPSDSSAQVAPLRHHPEAPKAGREYLYAERIGPAAFE